MTFLGRSGVKLINGLKVAYVSEVDFDGLSASAPPTDAYLGHYFTSSDLTKLHQDYLSLASTIPGVDLLLCSQPPLLLNPQTATTADELSSASSFLAALVDLVKPRYLYSSTQDSHFKRPPIKYPRATATGMWLPRPLAGDTSPRAPRRCTSRQSRSSLSAPSRLRS